MDSFERCVIKHLNNCERSTPLNLVKSLFKLVRDDMSCDYLTSTVVLVVFVAIILLAALVGVGIAVAKSNQSKFTSKFVLFK